MAYKEISRDEALKYLDFTTAISRWRDLYQCTKAEAEKKVIGNLDPRLIMRLGAIAKDNKKKISISLAFRPSSYQEMLAGRNGGVWSSAKVDPNKDHIYNMNVGWVSGKWSVAAKPGTSNHNTGAAADCVDSWSKKLTNAQLKPYGLTKNVGSEAWHIVVIEMSSIKGQERVKYAQQQGWEPEHVPCRSKYVSGKYVNRGAHVMLVQSRLKELGYYNTKVDGVFGSGTENAVRAFQKAGGLKVDGVCGRGTLDKLFAKTAATAPQPTGAVFTRVLKKNVILMKGEDVAELQRLLTYAGHATGAMDGKLGAKTQAAIKAFQKTKKLKVDGVAGKNTITALGGVWKG